MDIEFHDKRLAHLATEGWQKSGVSAQIITAVRKRLAIVEQAADERDLRAHRGLRFEKLKGDRAGQYSIRVNDQWRIVFQLTTKNQRRIFVMHGVVDYH